MCFNQAFFEHALVCTGAKCKKNLCTRAKFQKIFMHEFLTYVVIVWSDIKLPLLCSMVTKVPKSYIIYYIDGMFKK